jgi:hypothetical protein
MAGMYPDNQSIEIFGEQVQWPGMDTSGKVTDGSFSNPLEKLSFIPAGTLNLILDNLAAFIIKMGGTPNNTGANQLETLFTAAKLLEKTKTVDGANSEIDADKLDEQQGSYYAPGANPGLTGTNNTQIATTAFVRTAITALIHSSLTTLNTFNELAAALGHVHIKGMKSKDR